MKCIKSIVMVLTVLCWSTGVSAIEVVKTDNASLAIGGRLQLVGIAQRVSDSVRDDGRLYLFLRQARLRFDGAYDDYKFVTQLAFAGEEEVRAPSPGVSLNLLDLYFDIPVFNIISLRLGQFRVPSSREQLIEDAILPFAARSIHHLAFRTGRDVGGTVYGTYGKFTSAFGVFTGGGRDVPERFLPENLGIPMFAVRAGFNDGVDADIFSPTGNDSVPDRVRVAGYLNGFFTKDTKIGHSTVLNVKTADKSLLLNSNWNPYIAQAPLLQGYYWQVGADAALRAPLGKAGILAEVEGNYARYSNRYGAIDLIGGRGEVGMYWKPIELAIRYAFIIPDRDFANNSVAITGERLIHEVTPSATYHIKKDRAKIMLDFPLLINVPVITEPNVGAYVLTEQPDQASILDPTKTAGSVARKIVPEARLLFQLSF